ncbi:MAG TPA: DinB family protein [Longimicrobiales bacterium]|nr:DinB family protein [Longimicrobiales bacterium]
MDEQALFTKFWADESHTTLRVLERIPEGSDYRPDPKSRTAQQIAWQIVGEERAIVEALETGRMDWNPPPMPDTMGEIVAAYARQSGEIARRWKDLPAERWGGSVDLFGTERPAAAMAWSFFFDIIHHRGQITTYLRPMGSTVPQVYGPTADEP